MNVINQLNHQIYLPKFSHYDIGPVLNGIKNSCDFETIQKVAAIALPLLTTFEKTARPSTYFCQTIQILSHSYLFFVSLFVEKNLGASFVCLIKLTDSVIGSVAFFFNWKFGGFITTASAFIQSLPPLLEALKNQEGKKAIQAFGHTLTQALYLTIYFTGSLEIGLACLIIQTLSLLLDGFDDYKKSNYWDLASHLILIGLKIHSAKHHMDLIQKKRILFKLEKFQKLIRDLEKVRQIAHLDSEHPLLDLHQAIETHEVFLDSKSYGSPFFGLGEDQVKGMHIEMRTLSDPDYETKLNFSINHAALAPFKAAILELETMDQQEIQELFDLFSIPLDSFQVTRKKISFDHAYDSLSQIPSDKQEQTPLGYDQFEILELAFKGFGSVRIATDTTYWYLHSHVQVFIEKGKNLYDLHSVLSFVGLDAVLKLSKPEDFKRMEIGHLFRVFFPKVAHEFEVTKQFFQLPTEELKECIIQKVPEMHAIFDHYLDKISLYPILPGKYRVKINGLKEDLKNLGALGLTAAIYETSLDGDDAFARTIGILKIGLLSSEIRHRNNFHLGGLSVHEDQYTGGSDSVFTQMVTKKTGFYDELLYNSNIRILFDLEAIETSTYQYVDDSYGFRRRDTEFEYLKYADAAGITDFTTTIQERAVYYFEEFDQKIDFLLYGGQEVMIKERLPQEWIKGIIVEDEATKQDLILALKKANLLSINEKGFSIFDTPIDRFIHIGNAVEEHHFC